MSGMFAPYGFGCTVDVDVSNWNVSNVTNMMHMFWEHMRIGSRDLSNWDVSNVTDMGSMFCGPNGGTVPRGMQNWNVSNVTNMSGMFCSWNSSEPADINLSNWDISNVTFMSNMFMLNIGVLDISGWGVPTNISGNDHIFNLSFFDNPNTRIYVGSSEMRDFVRERGLSEQVQVIVR